MIISLFLSGSVRLFPLVFLSFCLFLRLSQLPLKPAQLLLRPSQVPRWAMLLLRPSLSLSCITVIVPYGAAEQSLLN